MTSDRIMKAISILLLILAAIGLVMSIPLLFQIQGVDDSEEGRAFIEELRLQMATELGLPLEEPPAPTATPEATATPQASTEPETAAEPVTPSTSPADSLEPANAAEPTPVEGVRTSDVIDYFLFITTLSIIDAVLQLLTGLVGLLRWNKPEKQVLPIVMGILLFLWMVVHIVINGLTTSTIISHLMNLLIPAVFIWTAFSNRKLRKPKLR